MKKISNFLKSNYKKIIVGVSCLTLLLVMGFSFLKPKQVKAYSSNQTDLNGFQSYFNNDYFNNNTEFNLNKISNCTMSYYVPSSITSNSLAFDFDFTVPYLTYTDSKSDIRYYSTLPKFITPTYSNYFFELKRNSNYNYRYTLSANYPILYNSRTLDTHIIFNDILLFTQSRITSYHTFAQAFASYFCSMNLGFINDYNDFVTPVSFYPEIFINYQYLNYDIFNEEGAYTVESGVIYNTVGNIISNSSLSLDYNFWLDFITNRASNNDYLGIKFPYVDTTLFSSSDLATASPFTYRINSVEFVLHVAPLPDFINTTATPYVLSGNATNTATLYNSRFYYDVQNVINSFTYIEQINENTLTDFSDGYNTGYNIGYDEGYAMGWWKGTGLDLQSPLDLIWDTVESFLNFEIFPNFKIYYFFLMALGITVFSLVIKYAFGG